MSERKTFLCLHLACHKKEHSIKWFIINAIVFPLLPFFSLFLSLLLVSLFHKYVRFQFNLIVLSFTTAFPPSPPRQQLEAICNFNFHAVIEFSFSIGGFSSFTLPLQFLFFGVIRSFNFLTSRRLGLNFVIIWRVKAW